MEMKNYFNNSGNQTETENSMFFVFFFFFFGWEGFNKNINKFGGIFHRGGGVYPFHKNYEF